MSKRPIVTQLINRDEIAISLGILDFLRNLTHLMTNLKHRRRCRFIARIGAMNLHPQALRALSKSKDFGF
jgi:hypothetical protein